MSANRNIDESDLEAGKRKKSKTVPFTERSSTSDICLTFDTDNDGDTKELFVPKDFICFHSPVIKSMFEHECREKKTSTIPLSGKKYEDFLEFLKCLHPSHPRPVCRSNVISVVDIASEYQVTSIEYKCKAVIESWLLECSDNAKNHPVKQRPPTCPVEVLKDIKTCLLILLKVIKLGNSYIDIKISAMAIVARYPTKLYSDSLMSYMYLYSSAYNTSENEPLHKECIELFSKLDEDNKTKVFTERTRLVDDDRFF